MPVAKHRRSARPGRGNNPNNADIPKGKKAYLYARVSSRGQEREGFSIPAQQALLRAYAADNGFAIIEEFVDVETAKKTGRTSFTKLLAALKKQPEPRPAILVEKTDRLYRNLKDWVTLDELKVDVHFVKEGVIVSEESRSSEKFIHGIKVLMAKNYVDNLQEEVKKGLNQKCDEGHYPGLAPIGYLNVRTNGRSLLQIDPEKALLVRNLFELYARGEHSIEALVEYARGVGLRGRHGGPVHTAVIHNALRNPLYAGTFYWGGKQYVGSDPTIVSQELFDRVQARLDGHPYTRGRQHSFAFAGLITCGHCGGAITAEIKKEKYVYYHCATRCQREPFVSEAKIAAMFCEAVRPLKFPDDIREAFLGCLKDSRRDIEGDVKARVTAAQAKLERVTRLINAAYEDKLEGRIDDGFFTTKRAEWEAQRADAAEEIQRLTRTSAKTLDYAINVFELANRAYDLLISREPRDQRPLLEVLLSNSVLAEGRVTVTFASPFDVLANPPSEAKNENGDPGSPDRRHSVWSGRQDSNLRPPGPEPGALPG